MQLMHINKSLFSCSFINKIHLHAIFHTFSCLLSMHLWMRDDFNFKVVIVKFVNNKNELKAETIKKGTYTDS